jgi:hypothetical protein
MKIEKFRIIHTLFYSVNIYSVYTTKVRKLGKKSYLLIESSVFKFFYYYTVPKMGKNTLMTKMNFIGY